MAANSSWTRVSLFYLAGYLLAGGAGLVAAPKLALSLLLAEADYGDAMPRLTGALMVALGIFIVQVIRHRLDVLYPATLVVRAFLLAILVWLLVASGDPLFGVLLAIVGFGFLLTGTAFVVERKRAS